MVSILNIKLLEMILHFILAKQTMKQANSN